MFKNYIDPVFLEIIEREENKENFNEYFKETARKLELSIISKKLKTVISKLNSSYQTKFPNLNSSNFLHLYGEYDIYMNDKRIYSVNTDDNLGKQYLLFKEKISDIYNEGLSILNNLTDTINTFYNFSNTILIPYIQESFKDNYYFKNYQFQFQYSYRYKFITSNVVNVILELSYEGMKINLLEIQNIKDNYNEEELSNFKSKINTNINDFLTKFHYTVYSKIQQKIVDLHLEVGTTIVTKGYIPPNTPYEFARSGKILIYPDFLELKDNEIEEFINKTHKYKNLIAKIYLAYKPFSREFNIVEKIQEPLYSLENKFISINMTKKDIEMFDKEVTEAYQAVINFDKYDTIPKKDYTSLYRYYIMKIDDYERDGDKYQVYRFKGRKNKTYYRAFKNGTRLTTNQQLKEFKIRELMKQKK